MNASETRMSSFTNETFELVQEGTDNPLGVSALVSRLNFSSCGSDAGSQGSPEAEGCCSEEQRPDKNFPWVVSFSKQCRAAIGSKCMKQLDDLLSIYLEHVTPHYRDCHKLPNKAAKLKRNINDTMIFFHMLYMDIREPLENAFYYDKMTELMAMFLDLEITASRRGKDTEKTVTNKLSTSLYTFLDFSEDHILDALLKTKLINKHSKKVCVPLLRKILSELVVRRPLAELTYVRFLLSFKLWKNVVADVEERRAINKLAAQRLHPPPEYFQDHEIAKPNAEILPRVPKTKKNCTSFYLGAKFNVKDACRAFFRFCKDTCRSNVYRRNISGPEEIEKPFIITSRSTSDTTKDVEESGSFSLINDIWSTISNGDSSSLLGESDMFNDVHIPESSNPSSLDSLKKNKPSPNSPDSRLDISDRVLKKDNRKKRENSVPDPKFVILKTEGVIDPIAAPSPAKGVQDCCLGSVFMMEEVNTVGGGQSHVKTDPCEAELPTSSRQHSVLESLVYAQPGSDNEAVASSSVSPDTGSVAPSHRDTNECDSSVEILQSRQISADVSLPLELKPDLNMEELRAGKDEKDLLIFTGSDSVADESGCFGSAFTDADYMFRLNDDLFSCRNAFEGMDQSSMMYRRADVTGSLPFQGSPLLEEDEDEFGRGFRWTSVPDYHTSIQSTIINQSTGTGSTSGLTSIYSGVMESKDSLLQIEEPKLGQDVKQGKGTTQGMLWYTIQWGGKVMRVNADVYARFKAAYYSRMQSHSLSTSHSAQNQSLTNSVLSPSPISLTQASGNSSVVEGSDNLKILAEEAVRVREASVAEAKSKSNLAANLNLPLKKRKSLPAVGDTSNSNGCLSYPSAPMLSIAQIQGINKSVIVMNSQYTCASLETASQVKNGCATVTSNTEAMNTYSKPIDMSATKKPANLPISQGGFGSSASTTKSVSFTLPYEENSEASKKIDPRMKKALKCCLFENCGGSCESKKYNSPSKNIKCAVCKGAGCNGNCNGFRGNSTLPNVSYSTRTPVKNCRVDNVLPTVRQTSHDSKCSLCQGLNCKGQCKINGCSLKLNMKIQKGTSQDSSIKAVLKCLQCKSVGCSGKCMTSYSRCSTSSSSGRKSTRCARCSASSCNGLCKVPGLKCSSCFSETCEGICHLTGRSTNNSLSTVNDFSILNTTTFTERRSKCSMCKNACCGRCKTTSGFKYCPYCCASVYNGCNTNHSVVSILANSSSKSKADKDSNIERPPKRARPSSSGRRTRSSSSTKRCNSATSNDMDTFCVVDIKRRKKSVSKPVTR